MRKKQDGKKASAIKGPTPNLHATKTSMSSKEKKEKSKKKETKKKKHPKKKTNQTRKNVFLLRGRKITFTNSSRIRQKRKAFRYDYCTAKARPAERRHEAPLTTSTKRQVIDQ